MGGVRETAWGERRATGSSQTRPSGGPAWSGLVLAYEPVMVCLGLTV